MWNLMSLLVSNSINVAPTFSVYSPNATTLRVCIWIPLNAHRPTFDVVPEKTFANPDSPVFPRNTPVYTYPTTLRGWGESHWTLAPLHAPGVRTCSLLCSHMDAQSHTCSAFSPHGPGWTSAPASSCRVELLFPSKSEYVHLSLKPHRWVMTDELLQDVCVHLTVSFANATFGHKATGLSGLASWIQLVPASWTADDKKGLYCAVSLSRIRHNCPSVTSPEMNF